MTIRAFARLRSRTRLEIRLSNLETVELETGSEPDGSVIWLHGLGADGHDFEPLVPELRLPETLSLRFVFPHAPVRPVSINNGAEMRAWHDIYSFDRSGPQDEQGIRESSDTLIELVEREQARGISSERILLAGFSQGGAIALHTALRMKQTLAGLLALSTWLPLADTLDEEVGDRVVSQPRDLPIFLAHGSMDPVLHIELAHATLAHLKRLGYEAEWHEYAMAHAVCTDEIVDVRTWLLKVFNA